jgi:hypothetical protein
VFAFASAGDVGTAAVTTGLQAAFAVAGVLMVLALAMAAGEWRARSNEVRTE